MSGTTRGPWRITGKGTIRAGEHDWVARVYWRNQEANARLIAASPDLLAAAIHAEAVLSIVEPRSNKAEYLETLSELRAAIAKATGEVAR